MRRALLGVLLLTALSASWAVADEAPGREARPVRVAVCAPSWPATWARCRAALPTPPPVVFCDPYTGLVEGCTWWPRTTSPYGPPTPAPAFVVGQSYTADDAPVTIEVLGAYLTPRFAVIWTGRTADGVIVFVPAATGGRWTRVPS